MTTKIINCNLNKIGVNVVQAYPTKNDIIKYILKKLKYMHDLHLLKGVKYKTLKGHVKRGQLEHIFFFLRKDKKYESILNDIIKFSTTEREVIIIKSK